MFPEMSEWFREKEASIKDIPEGAIVTLEFSLYRASSLDSAAERELLLNNMLSPIIWNSDKSAFSSFILILLEFKVFVKLSA